MLLIKRSRVGSRGLSRWSDPSDTLLCLCTLDAESERHPSEETVVRNDGGGRPDTHYMIPRAVTR